MRTIYVIGDEGKGDPPKMKTATNKLFFEEKSSKNSGHDNM